MLRYIFGIVMLIAALSTWNSDPFSSGLFSMAAVLTFGQILRRLL